MHNILLLQTGGTIAMQMKSDRHGMVAADFDINIVERNFPELREIANITSQSLFLEDSSNLNPSHWKIIAETIKENYETYDGFVILHGTDTMAYTATALSFALENLSKPVILTGSQVPMSNIRTDAIRNVINAVEMATMPIYDVAICFNERLYQGNRSTKISIDDFDAFATPNASPIAEMGVSINLKKKYELPSGQFDINPYFDNSLVLVTLFPGLHPEFLPDSSNPKLRAVIIEAFGSGNFPVRGEHSILPYLRHCRDHNVAVVVSSQAVYDAVNLSKYEGGRKALETGVVSAGDMTKEACTVKMMYLLAKYSDCSDVLDAFRKNLRGELTQP